MQSFHLSLSQTTKLTNPIAPPGTEPPISAPIPRAEAKSVRRSRLATEIAKPGHSELKSRECGSEPAACKFAKGQGELFAGDYQALSEYEFGLGCACERRSCGRGWK